MAKITIDTDELRKLLDQFGLDVFDEAFEKGLEEPTCHCCPSGAAYRPLTDEEMLNFVEDLLSDD